MIIKGTRYKYLEKEDKATACMNKLSCKKCHSKHRTFICDNGDNSPSIPKLKA